MKLQDNVQEYVSWHLYGNAYQGELEAINDSVSRTREAFACLVATLSKRGILTTEEIHLIAEGFIPESYSSEGVEA